MNGRSRSGLPGVSVTSFTPTPASPNAGIWSSVPAGVSRCDRSGATDGSCSRNPASRASMAAAIGRPAAELDGVEELHHSSPRYASRIRGLASRFAAVSASTTSPVWIT